MKDLSNVTDATIWAKEFIKVKKECEFSLEDIDEGLMIAWFANAIMAGYDNGRNVGEKLVVNTEANEGKEESE